MIVTSNPRRTRTFQYLAMFGYVLFLGFPLLWMLSMSFKGPRELVQLYPSFIPEDFTLENYRLALTEENHQFVRSAINSLKVAIVTALLTTAIGLPAAYVFARRKGIITRVGLGWILISQMFPLILIIIPLFLLLRDLKLTNSHIGLVVVYMVWALPFVLWMLYSYVRGIPPDLEEAATVDGATRLQILTGIIAPLLLPGIVVTTMFAFITAWNEFFLALVILESPDLTTLPLRLAQYVGHRGHRQVRPSGRGRPARDHPQHRPLHVLPALAHARPPLGGGQGLAMSTSRNPRRRIGRRQRPQKGGSAMKKVIVLGALALLCTVLVAGAQAGKQATVVKLKFATYVWQPTTVAANKSIVESWNKAHPGIQVEIVPVDVNSVHDKLLTSFVGGTAADIIHDEAADIAGFTQQGYLANLTPLLPKSLKASIPKDLWATTNFGGKITGVPSLLQTYNIFANMDILKSAGIKAPTLSNPWTWAAVPRQREEADELEPLRRLLGPALADGRDADDVAQLRRPVLLPRERQVDVQVRPERPERRQADARHDPGRQVGRSGCDGALRQRRAARLLRRQVRDDGGRQLHRRSR